MPRAVPALVALVLAATLGAACTEEERIPPDAGPIARRDAAPDAGLADAGPDQLCGNLGQMCCTQAPICRVAWSQCDTSTQMCGPCGDLAQTCCRQGPPCRGALLCTAGLCGP